MKPLLVAAALAALAAVPAAAATTGKKAVLSVKGTVSTQCTLATTPFTVRIGIGYIHAPGNAIYRQNSLSVSCTNGASTRISMNAGLYGTAAGAQFGSRSMSDGSGNYLGYELCHDSACSSVWSPSGYTYVSPSDKGSLLPVWTRIVTGQSHVRQGSYSDAVTVTINF